MKQREIWMADLNPVRGREQRGMRPVVVVSGDAMNNNLGICIVCPITTKIKNFSGCLLLKKDGINNLDKDSEVITFQIRTIAQERLKSRIGEITKDQMIKIRNGLSEILTY